MECLDADTIRVIVAVRILFLEMGRAIYRGGEVAAEDDVPEINKSNEIILNAPSALLCPSPACICW